MNKPEFNTASYKTEHGVNLRLTHADGSAFNQGVESTNLAFPTLTACKMQLPPLQSNVGSSYFPPHSSFAGPSHNYHHQGSEQLPRIQETGFGFQGGQADYGSQQVRHGHLTGSLGMNRGGNGFSGEVIS